ncbi:MAG: hypothetical protein AB7G11_02640 [Phycisphaerales bacterium]
MPDPLTRRFILSGSVLQELLADPPRRQFDTPCDHCYDVAVGQLPDDARIMAARAVEDGIELMVASESFANSPACDYRVKLSHYDPYDHHEVA